MERAMHVALSAQIALEARLDTMARNVANLSTPGYRADEIKFDAVLSKVGAEATAFPSSGDVYMSRQAGQLTRTENQLDFAVQGEGFFAFATPSGTVYTRDGRMRMLESGELTTLNGYAVLDVSRAPLVLDPNGGPPTVGRDGMITQGGQQLGAIGLFSIDRSTQLARFENSGVIPSGPATEILDFATNGVMQGFVEESNVNPVMEISRLVAVSRAFDAASSVIQSTDTTTQQAIRTLGETS